MKVNIKSILKKTQASTTVVALSAAAVVAGVSTGQAFAADNVSQVRNGVKEVGGSGSGNNADAFGNLLNNVINILLFLIGAIAVIMIIIGGIRYTTSNGDSNQAKAARDTIIYSIVGLVIAVMAFAIVNWVLKSLE